MQHLGLGDLLICNGLTRHYAKLFDLVVVPCKHHNIPSVAWMYSDIPNVLIRGVIDDECQVVFNQIWKGNKMYLGIFNHPFNNNLFDQEFYRQADLSFQLRWDYFQFPEPTSPESKFIENHFVSEPKPFIHDDPDRGFTIKLDGWRPEKRSNNIFNYLPAIRQAKEIHCINSSFAILIDSIDLPNNPKLFLHDYARAGEFPTFRKEWSRLKSPI